MRLVLTHPVRRGQILLAKYISAMTCLLVPLLMSLLLAIILLTTSTAISLSIGDFLRIGGIILSSIVYLSVFYLIGMLISTVTRRTGTALMLAMFIWGFWVLVYPNAVLAAIDPPQTSQTRMVSAYEEIKQIWEEFDRERKHFLANDAFPGEDPHFGMVGDDPNFGQIWGSGYHYEYFHRDSSTLRYDYHAVSNIERLSEASKPQVPHAQDYHRFLGPQIISSRRTCMAYPKTGTRNDLRSTSDSRSHPFERLASRDVRRCNASVGGDRPARTQRFFRDGAKVSTDLD